MGYRENLLARNLRVVTLVYFISALVLSTSFAQAAETPDTAILRNRTKNEAIERERQQNAPRVDLQGEAGKVAALIKLPEEVPCFKIDKFILEVPEQLPAHTRLLGASTQSRDQFRFAQDYLEAYTGRCIGRQGVGLLLKGLTDKILSKGYTTTRLGIPEQDMSAGTLRFTLIPGIIHKIRYADPSTSGRFNAFPASEGELFNLRDFEQGLEQMKRVTSQDVDMQIIPAAGLGESDIVISLKRMKPWKLIVNVDDSGSKGTGKIQAGWTLGLDNIFNASDMFTLGTTSDAENDINNKGTQGYSTSYSIPFGYWLFSFSASDYQYHQRVSGVSQNFLSSGSAQNTESKVSYLFYRDQMQKDTVQFRTGRRWSHSYIENTEVNVQYRNSTFAEVALIHKHYIGQSQLDMTVAYRWGVPWFGAQWDPDNLPDTSPKLNYQLETLDATLVTPFKVWDKQLNHTVTFRAQNSNSPLYASEWFSIGSRWTVRGFDGELTLGAEQGYFLRNEVAMPIGNTTHSLYVGVDYGKVFGSNVPNLIGDQLAGAVLGMRGSLIKGMSYEIFIATPLYKPVGFRTDEPTGGFSLSYQI
jgi:hemolysin activation/secretion protein